MRVTHLIFEERNKNLYLLDKKEKLYECVIDQEELTYIRKNVDWKKVKGKGSNINSRYMYKVFEGYNQSGNRLYYGVQKEGAGNLIYKPVNK